MKRLFILLLVLGMAFIASSEIFVLDFESAVGSYLDDSTSGIYTTEQNGVTLEVTFTAGGTTGSDHFNLVDSSFGINNSEGGDDTDAFDDAEYITMSFNLAGTFQTIEFDRLGSENTDDVGHLAFDGGSVFTFDGDSNNPLAIHTLFSINQIITLEHTGALSPDGGTNTRGFGLEKITVNVVPEPATIAMFGIGALITCVIRRSSRK